ncbi:type II secretion protein F [Paenibacillus yonginensis]|uniref:Type II secretion protein F n=1 Tax=Paenibacillus yonginensis TaxID=1462996 RepID=A0A1B1MWH8_9BACL|nr:type II secretion system F family protein [Paenibacillus yonginensis]ANS73540.1 type II secretion protein F [Paenibacillus yonginensis]
MTVVWGAIAAALLAAWLALYIKAKPMYGDTKNVKVEGLKLQQAAPPMLYVLQRFKIGERLPGLLYRLSGLLRRLYGETAGGEATFLLLAELLSYFYFLLIAGCLLACLLGGDSSGFVIGVLLAFMIPVALVSDLRSKVKRREQDMLIELPELLNKIVLLVGAGETVQQAFRHCLNSQKGAVQPIYQELDKMITEWDNGYSFGQALENFSRRCALQEVASFSTAVMLNYRRGGSDFTMALRELSNTLWEKRKSVSRTRGEQATSKLLLPMLLLFVIVLMLVGTPAFMMMSF